MCDLAINHLFKRTYNWEYNPRQAALRITIKLLDPDRPKTLEILCDRFINDPDEQVRKFAEKELAKLDKL